MQRPHRTRFSILFLFQISTTTRCCVQSATNCAAQRNLSFRLHSSLPVPWLNSSKSFLTTGAGEGEAPSSLRPTSTSIHPRCFRSEEHTSELQSRFDLVC